MQRWWHVLAGLCAACLPVPPQGGLTSGVSAGTAGDADGTTGDDTGPGRPVTGPAHTVGVSASTTTSQSTGEPEDATTGTTIIDYGSDGTSISTSSGSTSTGDGSSSSTGCPPAACDQPCGDMVPTTVVDAQVGMDYEVVFTGPDGVYEYDWWILPWAPPGLQFAVDGQPNTEATLSGTPEEAGDFDFTVIANPTGDGCVNADALIVDFTLTVDP